MDQNYLQKFQEFLVYHNKISDQNVRNVMRQVTKLANGEGIHYDSPKYGWKPHQIFQKGIKITPLSDFVELMELAQQAEDMWGRDHGNGWLLSHPLKKMLLFQQFCLQNPDFLLSKCRLIEYYEMDAATASAGETATASTEPGTATDGDSTREAAKEEDAKKAAGKEDTLKPTNKADDSFSTPIKKRGLRRKESSPVVADTNLPSKKKKKNTDHVGSPVAKQF
eukprot:scaffold2510_cov169-Amphora_coffeaeformis.AAC.27